VKRGLEPALAKQVAVQLMTHDALGAHARDELGISEQLTARPVQAALASAASFTAGAALPLAVAAMAPAALLTAAVAVSSLVFSRASARSRPAQAAHRSSLAPGASRSGAHLRWH
jgi:VIT1/CCC1 family predicted Fe2+/Mn2+ transporter